MIVVALGRIYIMKFSPKSKHKKKKKHQQNNYKKQDNTNIPPKKTPKRPK